MKTNISLIGMAGCGKSVVGKKLAYKLGFIFLDLDDLMEVEHQKKLDEIINERGEDGFINLENRSLVKFLEGDLKKTVISPGGSIVLSPKAMMALKKRSLVIFLDTPFSIIKKRFLQGQTRGAIIGLKNKSLEEVYSYRLPLYEKYSDLRVKAGRDSENKIVKKIFNKVLLKNI